MTWHSSIEYYRLINTFANERLGGNHAARCVLFSVDMGVIDELMSSGRWDEAGELLHADAGRVERAGADLFILGCNSLHNVWDTIVAGLSIPTIHIGDATADGLDAGLLARANGSLAFGPQTWPHALARVMLSEQVYRAVTILAGSPYHRD